MTLDCEASVFDILMDSLLLSEAPALQQLLLTCLPGSFAWGSLLGPLSPQPPATILRICLQGDC